MRPLPRARAFTLIEAMIVVAIVGVLALLAVMAYQKWIRTAYLAEAHDMLSNIRAAEESYRAENGTYLNVSTALEPGNMYPAATPGAFKTAWGGPCTTCSNNVNGWSILTIASQSPMAFGYAVVSDSAVSNPGGPGLPGTISVDGANIAVPTTTPAYVAEAAGDINGNSVFTKIYGFSSTNQLFIDKEGE